MGRPRRAAEGGFVYHVLNRANANTNLFAEASDFEAFERVLQEAVDRTAMRLLTYCLMPTHWHLVVWPTDDGQISRFARWLTLTHTQRYHAHHQSAGRGHLYQGRFKSFPLQENIHFYHVCRYVEGNPARAGLVRTAEEWTWSSLHRWKNAVRWARALLATWPCERPGDWATMVNTPLTDAELALLRRCVRRGTPFGDDLWVRQTVQTLGLESTLRPQGRPKKQRTDT